jgi:arsenite/tail-anchored protein-transporting ATPase
VTRVLLFTGKGGVGKTTVAAATALHCAEAGQRTLVLSTDPAHSLADALDVPLTGHPTEVVDGLWGQQLDARRRLEEQWGDLRGYLSSVLDWAGVNAIEAEELTVLPGLEEVLALTDLVTLGESGEWDVIVVDCAPTAETLRLLSLPQVLSWWMDRLFPIGRQMAKVVGPMARSLVGVPAPGDAVFAAVDRLYHRLGAVRDLLADGDRASVRLVVNPEKVVVAEARRTSTYLALFGFAVDAVVVNRLLPDEVEDPWFARWKAAQATQLEEILEGFAPLPVLVSYLAADEPVGVDRLRPIASALYGNRRPWDRLFDGEVLAIERAGDRWNLRLDLPFTDKRDVSLVRRGGELHVAVGPYRRAIVLPEALVHRKVVDASVARGRMTVVFA